MDAWAAAVSACEAAGDAWPLAYCRHRLAQALCATGGPDEAGEPLRTAVHEAEALDARPLLDDVVALARPPPPSSSAFGLTEREREVLALVAEGRSNSPRPANRWPAVTWAARPFRGRAAERSVPR